MSFSEIAALTIHDVKNRLAQLAARAERTGDRETLNVAIDAAGRLTELLTYYKSKSGLLHLDVAAHAPADLVDELVRESRGLTPLANPLAIEMDVAAAPALAFYDEVLVRMVLANAIHNASRYARHKIVVTVAQSEGYCIFSVRDDGQGYLEAVLADGGDSAPVSRQGTGLGLRLAGRIAELHENAGLTGRIELANDNGAVFSLRLPI
jgi:K+-sensing histidine kinase KdpD